MKLLLATFILLIALMSRLAVVPNGKIGEKEAVVSLSASECYQRVTDTQTYPRWMPSVISTESERKPFYASIGGEFVLVIDYGFLGTISYDAHILSVEPNSRFTFILDDWLETKFDFFISPMDKEKSRIKLTVISNKHNLFYNHIILPIAHLYYSNWLTQCLLRFQLTYS
ncbi:unnamed protein product [Heterobilharzia americana]|nr:unnamed protein product [Heterobilharzia americana]CAH8623357.1 unnamed protein product [Heterobilharzia americana]